MANPTVTIETNHGTIEAEMYMDRAPETAGNFIKLAKEGYYDGVIFHRVIEGFMIQGGDSYGLEQGRPGTGDAGYKFDDELAKAREHGYPKGTLAMANSGPNTNGSQFFIMHQDYGLPPQYAVFGKAIDGLQVVDDIATTRTGAMDRPVEDIKITGVDVTES